VAYNEKIGSKPTSSHTKGVAVDISVSTSYERFKILEALIYAGFNRIGIGSDFIHIDNDAKKAQEVCWDYYPGED